MHCDMPLHENNLQSFPLLDAPTDVKICSWVVCKKLDMWNASVHLLCVLGDQPSHYGYQRLWGTVGWGTFAIITGLLVDEFSNGRAQKDYTVVFYVMLVMLLLDVVVSSRLKVSDRFSFRYVMYWYCPMLRLYSVDVRWMNRYGVWVEWYWQGQAELLRKTPVPHSLSLPQTLHGLVWYWNWASMVRGWQMTVWAMTQPSEESQWN
jgi:hypothetical protein